MFSQLTQVAAGIVIFFFCTLLGTLVVVGFGARGGLWEVTPIALVLAVTIATFCWALIPRQWFGHRNFRRFAFMIVVATMVVVSVRARKVFRVKSAVATVLSQGGNVGYDYQWRDGDYIKTRTGWIVPSRLPDAMGDAWFAEAEHAYLGMGYATDENIRAFDLIPFNDVAFTYSPITDESLALLKFNPKLRQLGLSHTKVTDAGIKHLETLSELKSLWLLGTSVSDCSIESLAKLRRLKTLIVKDTSISPAGMNRLRMLLPGCNVH